MQKGSFLLATVLVFACLAGLCSTEYLPAAYAASGDNSGRAPAAADVSEGSNGFGVQEIALNAKKLSLGVGETFRLQLVPSGTIGTGFKVSSKKPEIASVTADGLIKAKKTGKTKIRVISPNGAAAYCAVVVGKKPVSIRLNTKETILGVGQAFEPKVTLSKGSASMLTWVSSNKKAVSIRNGVPVAEGVGTAKLTVSTYNNLTASCDVTVKAAPTALALQSDTLTLSVGMTQEIEYSVSAKGYSSCADKCTFTSSNKKVLAVNSNGVVKAVKPGTAAIKVSTWNGLERTCTVRVTSAPKSVALKPASVALSRGDSYSMNPVLAPSGCVAALRWKSSNPSVAKVDKNGLVTAVAAGKAVISVKTHNGRKSNCKVMVTTGFDGLSESVNQVVLVKHTGGSSADLSVHEKKSGVWKQVFSTSAYIGKNGIGKTKEGDMKTPSGIYGLTTPFGIKADPGSVMPYTKVTKWHYWCGTSGSEYYNQLCDSRVNGRTWTKSDEHLIDYTGVYNYCMFIDYNAAGVKGKGSYIFLHCFGKNKYTAGCVAISESAMKKIICWAKPGVKIIIE